MHRVPPAGDARPHGRRGRRDQRRAAAVAVGSGWNEEEFRAFGIPFDRRIARFEEAFEIVRRLLAGERVTSTALQRARGRGAAAAPARRTPLMVGGAGPRLLAATLPHVDWWNTWFTEFGNRAAGLPPLNARIDEACERAGRDSGEVKRSVCLLVEVDGGAGERRAQPEAPPLPADALPGELAALAAAGADEVILVLDPITEPAIRSLRTALPSG